MSTDSLKVQSVANRNGHHRGVDAARHHPVTKTDASICRRITFFLVFSEGLFKNTAVIFPQHRPTDKAYILYAATFNPETKQLVTLSPNYIILSALLDASATTALIIMTGRRKQLDIVKDEWHSFLQLFMKSSRNSLL